MQVTEDGGPDSVSGGGRDGGENGRCKTCSRGALSLSPGERVRLPAASLSEITCNGFLLQAGAYLSSQDSHVIQNRYLHTHPHGVG